ncbi:2-hydroxy-3-oxopropionate reductase [Nocardia otitidiscaviarum]|uniref:2-hydroxy-3-oxopropionate reductase n=1 Tax=Nocardia otitidiscaviarum TaxID=1823 RepID=A0A378YAJ3_9NOCA|nr:NAD(P)-binding domain-containing protein [Nocardia otitidiscaviarum]SUA74242.1 2-hydroxy-3-oxopropionate reductase [Nocardia otitidiscaviarum]
MPPQTRRVTVIGLGPMGQAMVRRFLAAGLEVTVWNRSTDKADAMVELGARRAATVADALDASPVAVLSLTRYGAMYDVLGQAPHRLGGSVIVNLSSDAPESTRRGASWVRAHGGQFLTGGVMAQPEELGTPSAYVFYSGPPEVFDAQRELLELLAATEYLGADEGLAQLYYQAMLAMFLPGLLAYEQALAMIDRSGESIDRFLPFAQRSMGEMSDFYAEVTAMARLGGFADPGHLRMMDAGAQHVVEASEAVGVDAGLAQAARVFWRKALAAGAQEGEPVSTYRILRGG